MKTLVAPQRPIPSTEAKRHFGEILDRVDDGSSVVIQRHGQFYTLTKMAIPFGVPVFPEGYFSECYPDDQAELSNALSAQAPTEALQ